jgi:hypothetical protein
MSFETSIAKRAVILAAQVTHLVEEGPLDRPIELLGAVEAAQDVSPV